MEKIYNVIIIGAGPAGLSAAIGLGSEMDRESVLLFDSKTRIGGQASESSLIENYPGFVQGVSGADLTGFMMEQASRFGVEFLAPVTISSIGMEGDIRVVTDQDGEKYYSKSVIIAGGLSYNRLKAIDVAKYLGRGIYYGPPSGQVEARDVFIIGGANSAGQAAVSFASQKDTNVRILVRKESIAGSMSQYLIEKVDALPNVEVCYSTEVVKALGNGKLEQLILKIGGEKGYREETVSADLMCIFIGASPKTLWLKECGFHCDERGYVVTGSRTGEKWQLEGRDPLPLETCVPGVFAIGDIAADSTKRVGAAVGAGTLVVPIVHHYLSLKALEK